MEIYYLLLLPITVIFAWILVFMKNGRLKDLNDRLFLVFSACCALTYYINIHSLVEDTENYHFIIFDNIETVVGLSICPLLFVYMRTVAHDSRWCNWYWWLFSPAVIFGVAGTVLSFGIGWDRIVENRIHNDGSFIPNNDNMLENVYYWINIKLFNNTIELMALAMLEMSVYYLVQYVKRADNFYSNLEDSSVKRMLYFLVSSIANLLILFFLTFFIRDILSCDIYFMLGLSVIISVLLFVMAYNSYGIIVTKDNLELINSLSDTEPSDEPDLHSKRVGDALTKWINRNDKPFCREGITLTDVAKDIEVSPRALSTYINGTMGMNFRRWINMLRIKEAKEMIIRNPDEKLTYIAIHCGFADIASFSKVFHLLEGCSPLEHRSNISKC